MALATIVMRLEGLAAIGDRARTEDEAGRLLRPNTYLEPFALRSPGVVRGDEALLERARDRFASLGLAWHASRTDLLIRDP